MSDPTPTKLDWNRAPTCWPTAAALSHDYRTASPADVRISLYLPGEWYGPIWAQRYLPHRPTCWPAARNRPIATFKGANRSEQTMPSPSRGRWSGSGFSSILPVDTRRFAPTIGQPDTRVEDAAAVRGTDRSARGAPDAVAPTRTGRSRTPRDRRAAGRRASPPLRRNGPALAGCPRWR